ncbi:DUF502 domain-containing protein [bacterium]|nr:DUF502 domain-containing protein [bacterium]
MWRWMRRHFLTGLLAVAPLAITAWVLVKFYELIDATMRPWLQRIPGLTEAYPEQALTMIAFVSFLLVIVVIGLATRSLVGVAFFNLVERVIDRIPVVKTIFSGTKQIASVFLTDQRSAFQKVLLFEYPRAGTYSIGFVTRDEPDSRMLNVFLPTTPNPTSGFMLLVPREQAEILPLAIEEGVKLIISGGSVMSLEQAELLQAAAERLARHRGSVEETT